MFRTLKNVWRRISFLGIFRFLDRLFYIGLAVGIALYAVFFITNGRADFRTPITNSQKYVYVGGRAELKDNIDKVLQSHWRVKQGQEPYLKMAIPVKETTFIFTKEHVVKEVQTKLKPYNYKVNARRSNRANGFVVKEDYRYDYPVRAYYINDIAINHREGPALWLISENYLTKNNLLTPLKPYEIEIPK